MLPSSSVVCRKHGKGQDQQCVMVVMGCGVWCGVEGGQSVQGGLGHVSHLSFLIKFSFDVGEQCICCLVCFGAMNTKQ